MAFFLIHAALHCIDSFDDGWHGGYIQINGTRYCEDFTNGQEKAVQVSVIGIYYNYHMLYWSEEK